MRKMSCGFHENVDEMREATELKNETYMNGSER